MGIEDSPPRRQLLTIIESVKAIEEHRYEIADRVEVLLKKRALTAWPKGKVALPATVTRVNDDGTYDVAYDDGDFDPNVPHVWLRLALSRWQHSGRMTARRTHGAGLRVGMAPAKAYSDLICRRANM